MVSLGDDLLRAAAALTFHSVEIPARWGGHLAGFAERRLETEDDPEGTASFDAREHQL
jgi:hypothetical protein